MNSFVVGFANIADADAAKDKIQYLRPGWEIVSLTRKEFDRFSAVRSRPSDYEGQVNVSLGTDATPQMTLSQAQAMVRLMLGPVGHFQFVESNLGRGIFEFRVEFFDIRHALNAAKAFPISPSGVCFPVCPF